MKFLRTISLIVVAVALSVGFLANDAQAAFLDSVRVVTPDSSGVRGIDSVITARAYFWAGGTTADSAVQVFFWLANKADSSAAVRDSTGTRTAVEDTLVSVFSVSPSTSVAVPSPDFVAAKAFIGVGRTGNFTASDADTITFSQTSSAAGQGYVAEVKIPIAGRLGEVTNIAVWATVYDSTVVGSQSAPNGFSTPLVAAGSHWFSIDALRPLMDTNRIHLTAVNPRSPDERFVSTTGSGTVRALSAGDSIQVVYDLGTAFQDIFGLGLNASSQLIYGTDTTTIDLGSIRRQVDTVYVVLADSSYPDITAASQTGQVALYLTDAAGNLSNLTANGPALGLTRSADFVIDAVAPALTAATGDTIYPADNDTITDGGINTAGTLDDLNPFTFKLDEALASLSITFDNADDTKDRTYVLASFDVGTTSTDPFVFGTGGLQADATMSIDFYTNPAGTDSTLAPVVRNASDVSQTIAGATDSVLTLKTGTYTVKLKGTDFAGNVGSERTITNVYVDMDSISLSDLFPTKLAFGPVTEARTDTIEESTSTVSFQLSEPADSVVIVYTKISGPDTKAARTRRLAGSELTRTDVVQNFSFSAAGSDTLVNLTEYALTVLARDLAGNYSLVGPDTFLYDTSFVVPLVQRFVIGASQKGLAAPATAGDAITLTITADATTDGSRDAVTYAQSAIIKVEALNTDGTATGVTLTGDGITDAGNGRATISADAWLAGELTLTLKDTTSIDTLQVTVVDSNDASSVYTGVMDSVIVYNPAAYTQIVVSAPDSVVLGEAFPIDLVLADVYGNPTADDRYVALAANKLGVEVPTGEIFVQDGSAQVMAKATSWSGAGLIIRATDLVDVNTGATVRDGVSDSVAVCAAGVTAVDAPDTLAAEDYMGADGLGDQGGFVMLTWDLSDDHESLSGYRIYREMQVNYRAGEEGESAIVMLDSAVMDWVPWGVIDAVPGEDIGRGVVATLDDVATRWAIAAEMDGETSAISAKEAFDGDVSVGTPYELMATTMMDSKKAAVQLADGPVFATLTPEALAFAETGVVPQLKSVSSELLRSSLTQTVDAVRAVDNIAPDAVATIGAMDTPNDGGSSVTVTWTKSASDGLIARSVPNAIGSGVLADRIQGVLGYNIYRRVGDGAYSLVGKAAAGETSFTDVSAINGVRYTYQVRAFDADNESEATVERTAMAIRNNVVSTSGAPIHGLFGMDNTVGFDDFFIFADNFGLSAADEGFEPAFDLVADAKIDFEDFFLFADSFGQSARVAGKVIPMMAGLNTDARLYLDAGSELPAIGEEVAISVDLADYAELKGYGLSVSYDSQALEFVRIATSDNSLLGGGELATPQIISQGDGEVAIAAYGETVSEGALDLSLVFRTRTEIENTYVEVTEGQVRDGNYAVNELSLPAPVQIQTRPEAYALANNYPNPFNPSTTIKYALPEKSFVKLEIYNVVGQVVRTLVSDQQRAGRYVVQWDANDSNGQSLSSGMYFYRLQAGGDFLEVKKMLLLK